jgi:hypothetical protein
MIKAASRRSFIYPCSEFVTGDRVANASGGQDYIETIWGRGYALKNCSDSAENLTPIAVQNNNEIASAEQLAGKARRSDH